VAVSAQEPTAAAVSPPDHYFSQRPSAEPETREVRLVVDGRAVSLSTAGGVFSAQRIDAGTSVLLQHAPPPPPAGQLLDLGCGYGPIACALAMRASGADVHAVDVNPRAVELTRSNAARLGLSRVVAAAPGEVDPTLRFSAIYSNPPIRIGKQPLHDLLVTWLDRLAPDGHAYLVVHRHLGSDSLQKWLAEQSYGVERLTSVRGYRILAVTPQ
jgi:16S rRNA (guanine1207-N2)-methyltransferase